MKHQKHFNTFTTSMLDTLLLATLDRDYGTVVDRATYERAEETKYGYMLLKQATREKLHVDNGYWSRQNQIITTDSEYPTHMGGMAETKRPSADGQRRNGYRVRTTESLVYDYFNKKDLQPGFGEKTLDNFYNKTYTCPFSKEIYEMLLVYKWLVARSIITKEAVTVNDQMLERIGTKYNSFVLYAILHKYMPRSFQRCRWDDETKEMTITFTGKQKIVQNGPGWLMMDMCSIPSYKSMLDRIDKDLNEINKI